LAPFFSHDLSLGYIEGTANKQEADYRIELTQHIDHEFDETDFISRCKDGSERAFSRQPKLSIRV